MNLSEHKEDRISRIYADLLSGVELPQSDLDYAYSLTLYACAGSEGVISWFKDVIDFRPLLKRFVWRDESSVWEGLAFNRQNILNGHAGPIYYIAEIKPEDYTADAAVLADSSFTDF
jgi:hypothetical protein